MKINPMKNSLLRQIPSKILLLAVTLCLAACAGTPMQMAEKNIEEGRLIPTALVEMPDFLNQYPHFLPVSRQAPIGLHVSADRKFLPVGGASTVVQVGIISPQPHIGPSQLHFLVYDSARTDERVLQRIDALISTVTKAQSEWPAGSSVTVDWSHSGGKRIAPYPALREHANGPGLEEFLKSYVFQAVGIGRHRFVLAIGEHDKLSPGGKQNIIDIANVFSARGLSLSVLSFDEKPDYAFLKTLAERGNGQLALVTEEFSYQNWLRQELDTLHAKTYSDLKLSIRARNGALIQNVISPRNITSFDKSIEHRVAEFHSGQQHLFLAEVNTPAIKSPERLNFLTVELEYKDNEKNVFRHVTKQFSLPYTMDRNLARTGQDIHIERSLGILETQKVLVDVENVVRQKRYFEGIALLTAQSRRLEEIDNKFKKPSLQQDIRTLNKYSKLLLDFGDRWIQTPKIWYDLSWDRMRFQAAYK